MYLPTKSEKRNQLYDLAIQLIGLLLLVGYTLLNRHPVFWDESYYLSNLHFIDEYGVGKNFLLNMWGPAGPLFTVVHYLLRPFTHIMVPAVRLVNCIILVAIILILKATLKKIGQAPFLNNSLNLISIPMIFVCAGMVLTEIPAMLFVTISFYFLVRTQVQSKFIYVNAILGGLSLSLAILGRQPYLLLLLPVLFLFAHASTLTARTAIFVFCVCTLALPLPVFILWGKLQPLHGSDVNTGSGLAPWHAILSFGYAALITALICPSWFYKLTKKTALYLSLASALVVVINLKYSFLQFLPMQSFFTNHFPQKLNSLVNLCFPCLILIIGLYFIFSTVVKAWHKRRDVLFLFCVTATLLLLMSSIKITHQFSSRYVVQAAPFLLIMVSPYIQYNYRKILGSLIAIVIGFASLHSFFA